MQTWKNQFYAAIAERHFGNNMSQVVRLLADQGSLTFGELSKQVSVYRKTKNIDGNINRSLLQFIVLIGIKHSILQADKGYLSLTPNGLLGREYLPELLLYHPNFRPVINHALQNGLFTIEALKIELKEAWTTQTLYNLILNMIDQDFVTEVTRAQGYEQQTKPQQQEGKKPKSASKRKKKEEKQEALVQKQEHERPQMIVKDDSVLKLNWGAILNYLKNQEILRQVGKIYGEQVKKFYTEFLKLRKVMAGDIELASLLSRMQSSGENMVQNSLQLIGVQYTSNCLLPQDSFERLKNRIKENLASQFLCSKLGPQYCRVFAILKDRKRLDDVGISDIGLLNLVDARAILAELTQLHLISTEVQKSEKNAKLVQVFLYDSSRLDEYLATRFYKSLLNSLLNLRRCPEQVYLSILNQLHLI